MTDANGAIRLYIAEEQQFLREAYQSFFVSRQGIDMVGVSGDTNGDSLAAQAMSLRPHVMLLGFRILQPATVDKLSAIRQGDPNVAVVVLSASYDMQGIKALREFSRDASVGCAYLLKHTIDTVEQLTQVIYSVAQGRIILDATVMEALFNTSESHATFLKEMTPREMEVLNWMAKGYRNNTIAEVLCLEVKTVERHINSIYGKLGTLTDSKHARVQAVILYMRSTGLLPADSIGAN